MLYSLFRNLDTFFVSRINIVFVLEFFFFFSFSLIDHGLGNIESCRNTVSECSTHTHYSSWLIARLRTGYECQCAGVSLVLRDCHEILETSASEFPTRQTRVEIHPCRRLPWWVDLILTTSVHRRFSGFDWHETLLMQIKGTCATRHATRMEYSIRLLDNCVGRCGRRRDSNG